MRGLVLMSGGLDSTVGAALFLAEGHHVALGLTVDYGQRAAPREIDAAERVAGALGFPLMVSSLPLLATITETALVSVDAALPSPDPERLDVPEEADASAAAVWVPNRNGLLVNLAAAVAEAKGLDAVVTGFNAEEARAFPDNGRPFVDALNAALALSTRSGVRVVAPCVEMTKAELIRAGRRVRAPIEAVWSCYEGGVEPCGSCESCRRRERAEAAADAADAAGSGG